jgi:hypothetical protein
LLAAAAVLLASAARAGATGPSGDEARVLRPGESRTIRIATAPAGATEWEAFLSVDGGSSFPVRITPHLPIAERSFSWTVPSLPTASARIRFRFGVGGVEQEALAPDRLAIAFSPAASSIAGSRTALGTPPATGEEDTLAWVERQGDRTFLVVADGTRGLAPDSRWSAAIRSWRFLPRHRPAASFAAVSSFEPGSPSLSGISVRLAPRGRSLASVSRLNL